LERLSPANGDALSLLERCKQRLDAAARYVSACVAPINSNLADYMVTVNADAPPIDVFFLDYPDKEINELGARGIGEIGLAGIAVVSPEAI